ncbi:MAG: SAM-dependent methyltransferase [Chloroflexi bacterium]|nr:SAM-dependent methyltransferase [Chloroflexota bacterium]
MAFALYHPRYGYYTRLRGFGDDGDFVTSPELHPVFGALLARQALDLWDALGQPRPFRIVEHGGGSGALARSLLAALPDLDVRYHLIETSPSLASVQRTRLAGYPVEWGVSDAPVHLVLANEVVDALPVERVVMRDGVLRERRVDVQQHRLVFVETDHAAEPIEHYFAGLGVTLAEGSCAEVNLGISPWVDQAMAPLERGLALVLDYGAPAEVLFARRPGTLLTYYRHTLGSDPLLRLGEQDISAQVDFSTLATAMHRAGLSVLGLIDQAHLLDHLGMAHVRAALDQSADRRALAQLTDPAGLGGVRVLFATRGLPGWRPAGLHGGRAWPPLKKLPTLAPGPAADADFLDQWREAFGDAAPDG